MKWATQVNGRVFFFSGTSCHCAHQLFSPSLELEASTTSKLFQMQLLQANHEAIVIVKSPVKTHKKGRCTYSAENDQRDELSLLYFQKEFANKLEMFKNLCLCLEGISCPQYIWRKFLKCVSTWILTWGCCLGCIVTRVGQSEPALH